MRFSENADTLRVASKLTPSALGPEASNRLWAAFRYAPYPTSTGPARVAPASAVLWAAVVLLRPALERRVVGTRRFAFGTPSDDCENLQIPDDDVAADKDDPVAPKANQQALEELAALPAEVRAGADRKERLREVRLRFGDWTPELAGAFDAAATEVHAYWGSDFYGLPELLGERDAADLRVALGAANPKPMPRVPGTKNAFTGEGSQAEIDARNEQHAARYRVSTARGPRQRGAHLARQRPRTRRSAASRRRGSRRVSGTRAGPGSDDPPDDPSDEPHARAAR
jgi:hypothetical protein